MSKPPGNPPPPPWQIDQVRAHFATPAGEADYLLLLRFAERRFGVMRVSSPAAQTAALVADMPSIVGEAIEDLLTGTRTLPVTVGLRTGLKFIIKSKISHLFDSLAVRKRVEVVQDEADDSDEELGGGVAAPRLVDFQQTLWDYSQPKTPADEVERQDSVDRFFDFCREDKLLVGILELVRYENLLKPAEVVAARLNVSVSEIYNAHRRLEGRLDAFTKLPD